MEGQVIEINYEHGYGRIETHNKDLNRLTFYLNKVSERIEENDTVSFEVKKSRAGIYYAQYVKLVRRNVSKYNTEDKQLWCREGELLEQAFVEKIVPKMNLDIIINPEKSINPYAIDLFDRGNNRYADLKSQNTPFFRCGTYIYRKSGMRYNPTYTMTFNKKDYERYLALYPNCDIFVCINWTQLEYEGIVVERINGVWRAPFFAMANEINKNNVYLHEYLHRKNDDINAKASYLFDLRDEEIFERMI